MSRPDIAVVYLARFAEGPDPIRKFIDSYKRHPAGIAHDLIIVWKGFRDLDPTGSPQKVICAEVQHQSITMTDEGLDLTAYDIASRQIGHEFVCLLNTFSQIRSDDWLLKFHNQISKPEVGIVGATGSYESLSFSMKLICKVMWMCINGIPYDPLYADVWPQEIVKHAPDWLMSARGKWWRRIAYERTGWRGKHPEHLHQSFESAWKVHGAQYIGFPDFPNPHIRSNAFAMRRELLLSMMPNRIVTKDEAFQFESGPQSVTAQLAERGQETLIVGADGAAYEKVRWRDSLAFRSGSQSNNLVGDNQTVAFDGMSVSQKRVMESFTWGPILPGLVVPGQEATIAGVGSAGAVLRSKRLFTR